ncbi:unnamed protein product [Rhizoctonia solani]|uniref:Uncharacterized protein n=1 Tax=Rhizoctonia solani TaxID=456999 RepID=A0A8H3CAI4_9AGAM|nr:unnamed protein product [Rhizoctonia solani]
MAAQAKAPVSRKRALSAAPPASFAACVVTYISQDRAFQRVFAETNIEGMKSVVREKLNLAPSTVLRLAQVVEGRKIDLEDDADFYAFQLGARLKPELQVEVSVIAPPAAQLVSPSVTATSINLDRAPPPLTQTGKGEAPQTADDSTTLPAPPKKRRKSQKSNLIIVDSNTAEGSAKPVEPTTDEQAPKTPKSKAKAADLAPQTTTTEPAKKPKSKAKSVPPANQEAPLTSEPPKQPEDAASEVPSAPPKPKKGKKAAAATTPAPAPTPAPETTPAAPTESIPETSSVDTEIPQPRTKKRGRKAAQDTEQPEPSAPEATQPVEPPAKKQRKSKVDLVVHMSGTQSPVATTLPPPVRTERRSSTVLSVPDPDKPVSSIGSAADILRRWGANSAVTEAASSSVAGPPTTTTDADENLDTKAKPKRKRKKKDQVADDASTSTSVPAPNTTDAAQCLVCSSGTHEPTECPLLSKRDSETAKLVEGRVQVLEDTQGPARVHQMLIGSLRRWLKDTKKQVEARNIPVTPSPAPTVQKSALPVHSTPIPTRPKKSKLFSVAVSHQSEGSSTEDEDILKSVMESQPESAEEDDGEDEEMGNASQSMPGPEPEPELQRETTRPSTPSPVPSPQPVPVPLPPSSPLATKLLLQSQRMSQSSVRALLDGLESEEAGDGEKDSSDEEGSDLARSTPSDVARRRHRKSVRLDVEDSEEEATARAQTQTREEDRDSDVEMGDGVDEPELTTLSQLLDSSEHIPEEIVGVVDGEKGEDEDIEEYEDEDKVDKNIPDSAAASPIENPDQDPAVAEDEVVETAQEEEPEPAQEEEESKPAQEDEAEAKPTQEEEPEPTAPVPKKRGRPPLSQAVKDERAAEKARIQAEKAATQADPSVPKKRGRPSKSKVEGEADTSIGGELQSNGPTTRNRANSVGGSQESVPKPRGRPRLSDNVRAEREAEKERVRAEKAIQRLEKKTAKANAKVAAKGKGANGTTPVDDGADDEDEDEDATVRQSFHAPEETAESAVVPTWSTLKDPSSSKHGSSQADEIEWSATEVGEDTEGKQTSGPQLSVVKPTPDTRTRKGSAPAKPLFMPSSGLGPRFLPPSSPLTSTPAPGKLLSLSQQTPSNALQRRKSIGSASLPRFTDIRKHHDLQQRSRKERNRLLSSQPAAFDSSQELKPKPNGARGEVVTIESSDEADSSAEEAKKPTPQSQRKRPSAFAYFEQ